MACKPASILDHVKPGAPAAMFCRNMVSYVRQPSPRYLTASDTTKRTYARWSGVTFPAEASMARYVAIQHTHDVIDCTSLRGGFGEWDMVEDMAYSSWISSCLRSMRLSGNNSRISTNAPDTTFATSFPGIGGNDGEMTTGGCVPSVEMTPLGATEGRGTECTAVVAAEPNRGTCCSWVGLGS